MRVGVWVYEAVDPGTKSKHTARWLWNLIMYGVIPEEWPIVFGDNGEITLKIMCWENESITGAFLKDTYGYQKGQNDSRDRVKMLGREVDDESVD
jgi:hypothetical protein